MPPPQPHKVLYIVAEERDIKISIPNKILGNVK
jgi:hypothetical protein